MEKNIKNVVGKLVRSQYYNLGREMSEIRTKDVLKTVLAGKPVKKELKKLGLSENELDELLESIIVRKEPKNYNRILGEEERRIITTDALGYLIHLLKLGSVNKEIFESEISPI